MTDARYKGGVDSDIIGSRAKQPAPDDGPLFSAAIDAFNEGENKYRVEVLGQKPLPTRARMPSEVALRGKTAPGSATSEAAARAMDESVPTLAWLVLQHINACGPQGATRDETATALGKRLSSISARIRELYLMGHIGSICQFNCAFIGCDHPRLSRINGETGLANEVMVAERYVKRWGPDQQRPPKPLGGNRGTE